MKNPLIIICLLVVLLISGCSSGYSHYFDVDSVDERAKYHKKCIVEIEQYLDISGVLNSDILFGWKQGEEG